MTEFIHWISQPWPWFVAGPIIAAIMIALLLFGNTFGVSSNLRTMCSMAGAGRHADFFAFDWRAQLWNIVFATGLVAGGFIAHYFLSNDSMVGISEATIADLQAMGIGHPGANMLPEELFSWESLFTLKGIVVLVLGGFMVGFGARYAGGCTSGHAITGLSNLQWPSLIAVLGFFIGGLLMTHIFLPALLGA